MNVIKENGRVYFLCINIHDGVANLFECGRVIAWQVIDDQIERKGMGGLPHTSCRLVGIGADMTPPDNAVGYLFADDGQVEFPDHISFDRLDTAKEYVADNQDYFLSKKSH